MNYVFKLCKFSALCTLYELNKLYELHKLCKYFMNYLKSVEIAWNIFCLLKILNSFCPYIRIEKFKLWNRKYKLKDKPLKDKRNKKLNER